MKNIWKEFYRIAREQDLKLSNSYSPASVECWRAACHRSGQIGIRLIALAWHESRTGKPLCLTEDGDSDREDVQEVSKYLGFSYGNFAQTQHEHPQRLSMQLAQYGFRLLRTNTCQYLRTIHRYSGVVFLKVADCASHISPSQWVLDGKLHDSLADIANRYAEPEEREELLADVRDFFARMAKRYRLYNTAPSFERCAAEEPDIPEKILKGILQKLWPDESVHLVHDTVPIFQLDVQGHPALGFPPNPRFSPADSVNLICFVFTDKEANLLKSIRFHLEDGDWQAEREGDRVPLASIERVVRKEFTVNPGETPTCVSEQNVTPSALAGSDFILFSDRNGQIKPIDIETSLGIGQRYLIASLSGEMPSILAMDDNEQPISVPCDESGSFVVPNNAASIQIGDNQYFTETDFSKWVNFDGRFQNVKNPGARLFFTQGTHLLSDLCIEQEDIRARYHMTEGKCVELQLPELAKGEVPAEILWDRGKLEFYDNSTQNRVAIRATTFFPRIDVSELGTAFELQNARPAHVTIGNAKIEIKIQDWCDQVEFTYQNVGFKFPLRRKGITMKLPVKNELIELQADAQHTVVARTDFDAADFAFLLSDGQRTDGALQIDQGAMENPLARFQPIPKRLRGSEIKTPLQLNMPINNSKRRFSTWSLDGSGTMVGEIFLYAPEQEEVCPIRDGADLVCKLPIAWKWRQRQLILVCFSRHRLDDKPVIIEADMADFEPQAETNLQVTLRFAGFYGRPDVDYASGFHAFIARRDKTRSEGIATITPMFNISRPTELAEWDGSCTDGDPFRLRRAIIQKDLGSIDEIMQSGDEECREYVRQFEARTFAAWNSIHCVKYCPAYKEGYFFMADWWLHEKGLSFSENSLVGRLKENYRRLWSPLLTTRVDEVSLAKMRELSAYLSWLNIHQFNEPGCEMLRWELVKLSSDVKFYIQEIAPDFHAYHMDPTFLHKEEQVPLLDFFQYNQGDFEKCLSRLGMGIAVWRRNPTCQAAQPLRDLLLRVEDLDATIATLVPSIGSQGRSTRFGMIERIALKAFAMSSKN